MREDLLGRARKELPSILDYKVLAESESMFNTPPTFAWYLSGLVFKWLKEQGAWASWTNAIKLKQTCCTALSTAAISIAMMCLPATGSRMNVPFQLADAALDKLFLEESLAAGLHALKGHRAVGGMRASIYNAMPLSGVKTLTDFMVDFERRRG